MHTSPGAGSTRSLPCLRPPLRDQTHLARGHKTRDSRQARYGTRAQHDGAPSTKYSAAHHSIRRSDGPSLQAARAGRARRVLSHNRKSHRLRTASSVLLFIFHTFSYSIYSTLSQQPYLRSDGTYKKHELHIKGSAFLIFLLFDSRPIKIITLIYYMS